MAANIAEFRGDADSGVIGRVKDGASRLTTLAGGDYDAFIASAVEEYGKLRPRSRAKRIQGAGDFKFQLDGGSPALPGFLDGFSKILAVYYPHSTTDPNPPLIEASQYDVVRADMGSGEQLFLWFFGITPTAAQYLLILYTTPHTVDASTSTISASDDEAIKDLAAALCCEALAAFYSQSTDGSIQADTINHLTKAAEYRSQAKKFRDSYEHKTRQEGVAAAVAVAGETNRGFGDPMRSDYFVHGRLRF